MGLSVVLGPQRTLVAPRPNVDTLRSRDKAAFPWAVQATRTAGLAMLPCTWFLERPSDGLLGGTNSSGAGFRVVGSLAHEPTCVYIYIYICVCVCMQENTKLAHR